MLVRHVTGFPQTLAADEWPEPREAKIDLLQSISDVVASSLAPLGVSSITFDPADVLKGKEVNQTLRLLQLLAIAAAREKANPDGCSGHVASSRPRDKDVEGKTMVKDLPTLFDAMQRCVQSALHVHEQAQAKLVDNGASPAHEQEQKFRSLQERLEEERQVRQRQEQKLAELQSDLASKQKLLNERAVDLDRVRESAEDVEKAKRAKSQHVEKLRERLLERAAQVEGNGDVAHLREQFAIMTSKLAERSAAKEALSNAVKRLVQQQTEVETQKESMEMEVQRIKLRLAEGLDTGGVQPQDEHVLQLQAEKQKLDLRVSALEEKLRATIEADDVERQRELRITEEHKTQSSRNEDVQRELQVLTEERDYLRENQARLWTDKARVEEELENTSNGYTHLSDRLLDKQDESRELEEKLVQYENLLKMLEDNLGKVALASAASPEASASCEAGGGRGSVRPGSCPPPPPPDDASSHYSDDDFEDPDDD